jgi:hypothetical protein
MNTLLLSALSAVALLPAAPPAAPVPVRSVEDQPLTGTILVLANERTVEGDIERIAGRYRIRRPVGETWIDGRQVLRLCAGPAEVYAFLGARLKAGDLDGRVRLAEWCLEHGLKQQALAEAKAVVAANKNHLDGRGLLKKLELDGVSPAPLASAPTLPAPPPSPDLDLTAEALNQFGTRVQPILMNACAGCHNEARGTAFRLKRTYEIGVGNRTTTHQNVAAVLAYVNIAQPQASPFLAKAIGVHWWKKTPDGLVLAAGDPSSPPFQNRNAAAYRAIEDWVKLTLATSPQLADLQIVAPPVPVPAPGAVEPRAVPVTAVKSDPVGPEGSSLPRQVDTTPSPTAVKPIAPSPGAASAVVPDAYSPDEFNRQNHPERVEPGEMPPKR